MASSIQHLGLAAIDWQKQSMLKRLLSILGDSNEKALKRLQPLVEGINAWEPAFQALSEEELRARTDAFKARLAAGEGLDELLPEAFAAVREAAVRTIGLRHFDVQLIGGIVLHQGKIAEMKTGEGKTLAATLPIYLNTLTGHGVHVVTVNDYLARRDVQWMGPIYRALGMTVGCLQNQGAYLFDPSITEGEHLRPAHRQEVYAADIVYGTNSEFGFDYLRDNMTLDRRSMVQRELAYGIVDEVDYILIDEARTPLIISGPAEAPDQGYSRFAELARRLRPEEHFTVDEKVRSAALTQEGISKVEQWLDISNLYDPDHYALTHYLENALRAELFYLLDKEYVVRDGQAIIVDEFTGRMMSGRRFADGLHQAIEAKEGLKIQRETVTLATITLQNYFRLYQKLAGMTGTAATEAEELWKIYHLDVVTIPTHMPMVRQDLLDLIYMTEEAKFLAVGGEIERIHQEQRPILVGTASIEASERLSKLLQERGVPHQVLNAKFHEQEATIVAQAGSLKAVTVATNMAGRGTDIVLGGSPAGRDLQEWEEDHRRVVALGGLQILGSERHESRRIDNQLRGRAGRQGDPGRSRFYVSLEDELMRRFGGDRVKGLMGWAGLDPSEAIENKWIGKAFENAQVKVEAYNFEVRKRLVEYDDVINTQRDIIYAERRKILEGAALTANIQAMVEREMEVVVLDHLPDTRPESWDTEGLVTGIHYLLGSLPEWATPEQIDLMSRDEVLEGMQVYARERYSERESGFGVPIMREVERLLSLQTIDMHWIEHLTAMDTMRQGIGLEAVGQRDPLVAYRTQAHQMYQQLQERIQSSIVRNIYHVNIRREPATRAQSPLAAQQRDSRGEAPSAAGGNGRGGTRTVTRTRQKVGRNDTCPCGSGKKYKRCHWPNYG